MTTVLLTSQTVYHIPFVYSVLERRRKLIFYGDYST